MDQDNGFGYGTHNAPMPNTSTQHPIPVNHQLTEHGVPDPVPHRPAPAFTTGDFAPSPQPFRPSFTEPPTPREEPASTKALSSPTDDRPVPVVKVLSVRGVEYAMMTIMLWFGAASLIWIIDTLILGGANFEVMSFPLSVLLIALPIFAFLYLRLREAELADPSLRLEPSKRRFSQLTQIVAFLTCVFNLIGLVYILVGMAGGHNVGNIGKTIGATFVTLLVAGGILVYYWFDEHKLIRR